MLMILLLAKCNISRIRAEITSFEANPKEEISGITKSVSVNKKERRQNSSNIMKIALSYRMERSKCKTPHDVCYMNYKDRNDI